MSVPDVLGAVVVVAGLVVFAGMAIAGHADTSDLGSGFGCGLFVAGWIIILAAAVLLALAWAQEHVVIS